MILLLGFSNLPLLERTQENPKSIKNKQTKKINEKSLPWVQSKSADAIPCSVAAARLTSTCKTFFPAGTACNFHNVLPSIEKVVPNWMEVSCTRRSPATNDNEESLVFLYPDCLCSVFAEVTCGGGGGSFVPSSCPSSFLLLNKWKIPIRFVILPSGPL